MVSRQLMRGSHRIFSAAILAVCANVVLPNIVLAQTVPDTSSVRGRVGGGGGGRGQGGRMSGAPGGFDGVTPQMFEAFVEKMMRDRVQLSDEQIVKWRAWNKRFDPERRALGLEERETRKMLRMQLSPSTAPDDAKAADILERLAVVERKQVALHERENKDLSTFVKPTQRLRFFALQDQVKREMQEAQSRRDGGRGNGGQGGRGGSGFGPDSNKFRGMRGDSTGKFQRGGPPGRGTGRVDTFPLVQKPKNN